MAKLAIIGAGNLGASIAEGLITSGFITPGELIITRRNIKTLEEFSKKGVQVTSDNNAAIANSTFIIVALKPYQVKGFLKEHSDLFREDQVIISTVTGVSIRELKECISGRVTIFRAMPNTAIAIRESMTCVCHESAKDQQIGIITEMFSALGKVAFIDEKLMDGATVLAACGTAFAMRYIRANIQGGVEIGFDVQTASLIAAQTVAGAAQLLLQNKTHPEQEIDKVATPRGCTISGLNEMEHQGFSSALIKGLLTSYHKIADL